MANLEVNLEDLDYDQDGADLECGGSVRRPMNAFLIFCKRHRSLVREKYPHLENRSITKILGELWANLEPDEKVTYTEFAKQYKEAFMKANPDFKWSRLPSPPSRTLIARPSQLKLPKLELGGTESLSPSPPCGITPGKLADETQMGGLSSLITPSPKKPISKPPKKRYLENGAFKSQPPDSAPAPNPASSPSTAAPICDAQANSDCSALLKLAEVRMCSKELVEHAPSPVNSSSKLDAINGRAMGNNGSTSTIGGPAAAPPPTSSPLPSPNTSTPSKITAPAITSASGFSFSKFGKMMQQMAESSGTSVSASSGLHAFSSTLPERRPAGQGAGRPAEDEPLDLCKEKILTASHQQLIDCIIDNILPADDGGATNRFRGKGFPASSASRLPRVFDKPAPSAEAAENEYEFKDEIRSPDHEPRGPEKKLFGSGKKIRGAGPSHRFGEGAGGEDPLSPRKSQRSCKGKRYQAFMSEGVLQPAKERKLSSGSRKPSSSDGVDESLPPMRTRTPSDSSESVTSRKSDKDDALKTLKSSRCSTPTDEETESVNCAPANSDPSGSRHKTLTPDFENDKDRSRKRFKAGNFDLEESIAALPKCNFEALDRRKQRRQGSSNSSNSSRKISSSSKDEKKQEQDNALDMGCLSEDSSEKADSSSSESRGEKPILVGSQKRKARKRSITHLDPAGGASKSGTSIVEAAGVMENLKLVALAEVATSEERMPSAANQNDSDSPTGSA